MAQLGIKETQQLIEQAAPYYLPDGYHIGEHRLNVLEHAQSLGSLAMSGGVRVDGEVLVLACNWHDAGTAIMPDDFYVSDQDTWRPAKHSEEVAAQLFINAARRVGAPQRLVKAVNEAILGTNPSVALKTTEAKIVAAADIHDVGLTPFSDFIENTKTLWHEAEWRQAKRIAWQDFVLGSMKYLGLFIARDIHLTDKYYDTSKRSAWHVGAVDNVIGLAREAWGEVVVRGDWQDSCNGKLASTFSLELAKAMHQTDASAGSPDMVRISVPTHNQVLSLPESCLDELYISDRLTRTPGVIKEASKALRDSGVLVVKA